MRKTLKVIGITLAALVAVVVIAVVGMVLFVDPNRFKPQLEQAATDAIGFEVAVDGDLRVTWGRTIQLILGDVRLHSAGRDIGSAPAVTVGIAARPLLRGEMDVRHLVLTEPHVNAVRDADGQLNVVPSERPGEPEEPMHMRVSVQDGRIDFHDEATGAFYAARGVELVLDPLRVELPRDGATVVERLMIALDATLETIETPMLDVRGVALSVIGEEGRFQGELARLEVLGGLAQGHGRSEREGDGLRHQLHFELRSFQVGAMFALLGDDLFEEENGAFDARGDLDFTAELTMRGDSIEAMLGSLNGGATLMGRELVIQGANFDEKLSRYDSLTDFNVVDAGAVFFAGPVGFLIARAQEFAELFEDPGEETKIRALHSVWDVEGGVARTRDVALATASHRIAMDGGIDFANRRFDDVKVAVIDDEGCVLLEQSIAGTFEEPEIDEPSLPEVLAEATFELLEEALELLGADDCDLFYDGALPPPD